MGKKRRWPGATVGRPAEPQTTRPDILEVLQRQRAERALAEATARAAELEIASSASSRIPATSVETPASDGPRALRHYHSDLTSPVASSPQRLCHQQLLRNLRRREVMGPGARGSYAIGAGMARGRFASQVVLAARPRHQHRQAEGGAAALEGGAASRPPFRLRGANDGELRCGGFVCDPRQPLVLATFAGSRAAALVFRVDEVTGEAGPQAVRCVHTAVRCSHLSAVSFSVTWREHKTTLFVFVFFVFFSLLGGALRFFARRRPPGPRTGSAARRWRGASRASPSRGLWTASPGILRGTLPEADRSIRH